MTAKEKFIEEKDEMKQNRKNRILESAFNLFSQKGIDTIAMTDIAKNAEIGVASLYRYYETKEEIATNANLVIPNATLYEFSILTSNVHMAWMRAVAGRLKSD